MKRRNNLGSDSPSVLQVIATRPGVGEVPGRFYDCEEEGGERAVVLGTLDIKLRF